MTISAMEEALALAGVTDTTLSAQDRAALDDDGYVLLRGVLDAAHCESLRAIFERTYLPSHQWPAPRGPGARHALLDHEPEAWRAALAPRVLACARHLMPGRFFLYDVQGRDPRQGQGGQPLHRDWVSPQGPAPMAVVLAFLDPFGPDNGATRVVPRTHRMAGGADAFADFETHPDEIVIAGAAGDILVCDGYLVHGGTRNASGAPRRNLQIALHVFGDPGYAVPRRDSAAAAPHVRYLLGLDA